MQIINSTDDATLPWLCKWQFLCQRCTCCSLSADAMWWCEDICAFWEAERDSVWWYRNLHTHAHSEKDNLLKVFPISFLVCLPSSIFKTQSEIEW